MGLIGSGIGAGLSAIGTIGGGIAARKAIRKVKKNIQGQMEENEDWFNRRYNEDSTQRADAQAILTDTQNSIRERNKEAAGTQAVMGGTDESLAASREANNKALSSAATNISVAGDARKDNIESQYQSTKSNLNSQLNDLEMKKAENIQGAVKGVTDAASSLSSSLPF